MSHRSQIAYLSIAKIKIIYGNNIFIFCFRTAEDVGPYKFWHMPFVSSMDGCAAVTDIFGRGYSRCLIYIIVPSTDKRAIYANFSFFTLHFAFFLLLSTLFFVQSSVI